MKNIQVTGYHSNVWNGPGANGSPRFYITGTTDYGDLFQNYDPNDEGHLLKPEIVELILQWIESQKTNPEVVEQLISYDLFDPEEELDIPEEDYKEISDPIERLQHLLSFDKVMRNWIESDEISEAIQLVDSKGNKI